MILLPFSLSLFLSFSHATTHSISPSDYHLYHQHAGYFFSLGQDEEKEKAKRKRKRVHACEHCERKRVRKVHWMFSFVSDSSLNVSREEESHDTHGAS